MCALPIYYAAMQPLLALNLQVHDAGRLEPALIELVLMRVSQINGCAYCLDMHSKDARAASERPEERRARAECVSQARSRWPPYHKRKKQKEVCGHPDEVNNTKKTQ